MDLNKSLEFFDPSKVEGMCHVIGCGSIGSNVAELLTRYGVKHITLWDLDEVEPHNIANQIYTEEDVGFAKTLCLSRYLFKINPQLKRTLKIKGKYQNTPLNDYVFMCVDSVEVRRELVEANMMNPSIKAIFDFRTTLLEGQCYFADWTKKKQKESLLTSLQFSHEEAMKNTPVSACGFELSVSTVVKMTAIMGIVNFTNFINKQPTKHLILCQPYSYFFEAM
jgi:molybdopterin/thiamine biosynthesis adenylyltransferase